MIQASEPQRFGMTSGNDPSAGSPTETLPRLLLPLKLGHKTKFSILWASGNQSERSSFHEASDSHLPIRVVATGGVYKGQGRNQRELMTRTYWEFLVQGK